MDSLRMKLNLPETDPPPGATEAFTDLAEIHSDQAIFQINRTQYVDSENWGFKLTYRANSGFVQSTRPSEIEQTMARVAPSSFQRRVTAEQDTP